MNFTFTRSRFDLNDLEPCLKKDTLFCLKPLTHKASKPLGYKN